MSLESGKKLGLVASIINVVVPVVVVAIYAYFVLSLIFSIESAIQGGLSGGQMPTSPFDSSLFAFGALWITLVALSIISFIGLILFVVAMYQLGHHYNETGIFRNTLYSILVSIIGVVVLFVIVVVVVFGLIVNSSATAISGGSPISTVYSFIIALIVVAIIGIIIAIISALFMKRAFNKLAEKSGVGNFNTTGLLYLLGAALAIVGIGYILSWIAWIFAAIGYSRLKPAPVPMVSYPNQPLPPPMMQTKHCLYCGAENGLEATYCRNCGSPL